jgi:hypothetical protein
MLTPTDPSGVPPLLVIVPEIRPPSASAKLMPLVVEPAVTVIGVPDVTVQLDEHGMSFHSLFT